MITRQKRVVTTYTPAGGGRYDSMSVTYFPEQGQYLIHQTDREWDLPWFDSRERLLAFLTQAAELLASFDENPPLLGVREALLANGLGSQELAPWWLTGLTDVDAPDV